MSLGFQLYRTNFIRIFWALRSFLPVEDMESIVYRFFASQILRAFFRYLQELFPVEVIEILCIFAEVGNAVYVESEVLFCRTCQILILHRRIFAQRYISLLGVRM